MEDINILVGRVIKAHRKAKKINQIDAGEIAGLSQQQYRRYESGESDIKLKKLVKIAEAFEIPMDSFFDKVKTKDLIKKLEGKLTKQKDILDTIESNPLLKDVLKYYSKNAGEVKDLDLLKLLSKFKKVPKERKKYVADSIYNVTK